MLRTRCTRAAPTPEEIMAAVRGPLFSFDASGSLASTITFSKWKGRPYVRQHVIPSNPKTIAQQGNRAIVRYTSQAWATLGSVNQAPWNTLGAADSITGLDAWTRSTARRKPNDQAALQTPAAVAGTTPGPPLTPAATGGKGQVTLSWTNSVTGTLLTTAIHRGTTGFTPGPANLIWLVPSTTLTIVLTGFAPGTYFFKFRHGNIGGIYGTASTEVTAVVT